MRLMGGVAHHSFFGVEFLCGASPWAELLCGASPWVELLCGASLWEAVVLKTASLWNFFVVLVERLCRFRRKSIVGLV